MLLYVVEVKTTVFGKAQALVFMLKQLIIWVAILLVFLVVEVHQGIDCLYIRVFSWILILDGLLTTYECFERGNFILWKCTQPFIILRDCPRLRLSGLSWHASASLNVEGCRMGGHSLISAAGLVRVMKIG